MPFTLSQIIEKKAKNEALSTEDIETIVKAAANNSMDSAQIGERNPNFFSSSKIYHLPFCFTGAFLMAVYINDMSDDECACLTTQMSHYGDSLDFSKENWAKRVVDKHSTGGVGDKISLLLTPALAAYGCKVRIDLLCSRRPRSTRVRGASYLHHRTTVDTVETVHCFCPSVIISVQLAIKLIKLVR